MSDFQEQVPTVAHDVSVVQVPTVTHDVPVPGTETVVRSNTIVPDAPRLQPTGAPGVLPADHITVDQSTTTLHDSGKTTGGQGNIPVTEPEAPRPAVNEVPGRDSAAADQFSTPMVDLKLTTGSLWARNEEESRAAFAENSPSREIDDLRTAMIDAEQRGSLIHNPDMKKAALERDVSANVVVQHTPIDHPHDPAIGEIRAKAEAFQPVHVK